MVKANNLNRCIESPLVIREESHGIGCGLTKEEKCAIDALEPSGGKHILHGAVRKSANGFSRNDDSDDSDESEDLRTLRIGENRGRKSVVGVCVG
jgi:hypothetical protein